MVYHITLWTWGRYPVNFVTAGAELLQAHRLSHAASPLILSCSFQLGSNTNELLRAKARAETIFSSQLRITTELKYFKHWVRIYRKHIVFTDSLSTYVPPPKHRQCVLDANCFHFPQETPIGAWRPLPRRPSGCFSRRSKGPGPAGRL